MNWPGNLLSEATETFVGLILLAGSAARRNAGVTDSSDS
jgi:hypothetical protein